MEGYGITQNINLADFYLVEFLGDFLFHSSFLTFYSKFILLTIQYLTRKFSSSVLSIPFLRVPRALIH